MAIQIESPFQRWAELEFGAARFGDQRLDHRLVGMAAQAAETPHGQIQTAFNTDSAMREAAYKHLEHGRFPSQILVESARQAAWRRALIHREIVVAVDPCTLSLPHASWDTGYGRVSPTHLNAFGMESIGGVLLSPGGTPLGVGALQYWIRPRGHVRPKNTRQLPIAEKETRFWLEAMEQLRSGADQAHYVGRIKLQFDAGADAREILELAAWDPRLEVTVRCRQARNIVWPEGAPLQSVLAQQPVLGQSRVRVKRNGSRAGRRATVELRASEVLVPLRNPSTRTVRPVALFAVQVTEVNGPPGDESIAWMLLTTSCERGFRGARQVMRNYALRWRAEEVYKTWKTGECQVEASGLNQPAFESWATILFSVAVRTERLKYLARTAPELHATAEFTPLELEALLTLRRMHHRPTKDIRTLTIREAVDWIAELGGYYRTPSRGPPGSIVIGRGLRHLAPIVELLAFQRSEK